MTHSESHQNLSPNSKTPKSSLSLDNGTHPLSAHSLSPHTDPQAPTVHIHRRVTLASPSLHLHSPHPPRRLRLRHLDRFPPNLLFLPFPNYPFTRPSSFHLRPFKNHLLESLPVPFNPLQTAHRRRYLFRFSPLLFS